LTLQSIAPAAVNHEPETASANYVQSLKLNHIALAVAADLYRAAVVLWPDHPDYPADYRKAPGYIHDRMLLLAQGAVAAVNEAAVREAERQAMLALERTYDECERDALLLDADHSQKHLVIAAFQRLRMRLFAQKPTQIALAVYRTALRKGGI
jgi:hypothetical protein